MRVTIHQPQFLPWLGYLDKIDRADLFIVLETVNSRRTNGRTAIASGRLRAGNG
ncbi:MAG: WbqC family protein [Nitrospira sp.]